MKSNVGNVDKIARVSLGVAFVFIGLLAPISTVARFVWVALSMVLFVTAFSGYCPLNQLLGINTHKGNERIAMRDRQQK
jgi:hypothetical protein